MIRRHVLAALAAGVDAGDEDVARAALAGIDPVLRPFARRRLEATLLDAGLAVGMGDEPDEVRERLRTAAVLAAGGAGPWRGRAPGADGDRAGIARAYAALAVARPTRLPIATGLAALAGAGLALGLVLAFVGVVTADTGGAYTRPPPPPVAGAFRDGGAPRHDPALEHALAVELPALDAHRVTDEAGRAPRVAALRIHRAFAAPRSLASAWRAVIDTFDRWQQLGSSIDAPHRDAAAISRELRARVASVSDQLAAAGLGYVLDVELGADARRRAGIYAYRVDEVAFVRAGDARIRVLGVRRLDHLADEVSLLGMTTGEPRDPRVLLDEVDAKVRTQIVPILQGQPYLVGDDAWARTRTGRRVAFAASEAIRRELHTALGTDAASLDRALARCRKLVAASVRHHEAQHGLDRGRALPYPAALAPYAGPASSEFALRTRHELSGYLSQIASDTWLPQLTLWNLARHAFRSTHAHREEAYVAVFVIEGLARELGVASPGPVIHRGAIDRERLAALVIPLAERATTELRSAAAAVWRAAFEARLARIVDE